ncbi:serine O-acetyltransferase, partial [Streptomyces acidiscabies]
GSRGIDDPFGAPTLGKNVQIGANAVLIGRITVGDGARIGAGAIVVKDVPTGATAVGNPAVVRLASSSGSARRV